LELSHPLILEWNNYIESLNSCNIVLKEEEENSLV
jgi:hypothetical protein